MLNAGQIISQLQGMNVDGLSINYSVTTQVGLVSADFASTNDVEAFFTRNFENLKSLNLKVLVIGASLFVWEEI